MEEEQSTTSLPKACVPQSRLAGTKAGTGDAPFLLLSLVRPMAHSKGNAMRGVTCSRYALRAPRVPSAEWKCGVRLIPRVHALG